MALLAQDVVLGSYPTGELSYLLLFSVLGCFLDRTSFVADRLEIHHVLQIYCSIESYMSCSLRRLLL